MAMIKPDMQVFFANNGKPITATISKVKFRRYYAKVTDIRTGKKKSKAKSMPLAVCKVILSLEFVIAGYKLQNVVIKNERMLTFKNDFVADYAKDYGNEWVRRLINEDR
jgi:hypothetical protein